MLLVFRKRQSNEAGQCPTKIQVVTVAPLMLKIRPKRTKLKSFLPSPATATPAPSNLAFKENMAYHPFGNITKDKIEERRPKGFFKKEHRLSSEPGLSSTRVSIHDRVSPQEIKTAARLMMPVGKEGLVSRFIPCGIPFLIIAVISSHL